jgi:hypothetical protein
MSQAAANELQQRLVSFAVKIIELVGHFSCPELRRSAGGRESCPPSLRFGGQAFSINPAFLHPRNVNQDCSSQSLPNQ